MPLHASSCLLATCFGEHGEAGAKLVEVDAATTLGIHLERLQRYKRGRPRHAFCKHRFPRASELSCLGQHILIILRTPRAVLGWEKLRLRRLWVLCLFPFGFVLLGKERTRIGQTQQNKAKNGQHYKIRAKAFMAKKP